MESKKKYLKCFYIDEAWEERNVEIILREGDFLIIKYPKIYGSFPQFYEFSAKFVILKYEDIQNRKSPKFRIIEEFEYNRKNRKEVLEQTKLKFKELANPKQGGK